MTDRELFEQTISDLRSSNALLAWDRMRMSDALIKIQQRAAVPTGWGSRACRKYIYDTATNELKPRPLPESPALPKSEGACHD
jgi:hypothetical protein